MLWPNSSLLISEQNPSCPLCCFFPRFHVGLCSSLLQIFLNKCPNLRKKLLVPCILDPPSANCYVCVSKPEVTVKLNVHKTTVLSLQDRVILPAWLCTYTNLLHTVYYFLILVVVDFLFFVCSFFFSSDPEGEVWHGGSRCSDRGWKRDHPHLLRGRRN